ncbi:MAG TPA: phosphopantetheine-binding protein [bacterium]|nr:phosphopantetheine-binding protein [bacterium]
MRTFFKLILFFVKKTIKTEEKMEQLIKTLKDQIIDELNLEDMSADEIDAQAPLFGEGLGLDSIDALSLIVLLEREYGKKINDTETGKKVLYSIKTMAEFIKS